MSTPNADSVWTDFGPYLVITQISKLCDTAHSPVHGGLRILNQRAVSIPETFRNAVGAAKEWHQRRSSGIINAKPEDTVLAVGT